MASWIKMINDDDADSDLQDALDAARTPHGTIDNVMRVHSLRPNTMHGHMKLYRAVLHDEANTLPTWLQEVIGSYVSALNQCDYSYANHWKNAAHLIGDKSRADSIEDALKKRRLTDAFDGAELAVLQYAETLTLFHCTACFPFVFFLVRRNFGHCSRTSTVLWSEPRSMFATDPASCICFLRHLSTNMKSI